MYQGKPRPLRGGVTAGSELFWLAGLLEGEGAFLLPPPSSPGSPVLRLAMTDRDVVARAAALWRRVVCLGGPRREPHLRPVYVSTVKGSVAVAWMRALYPAMGARRRQQIDRATSRHTARHRRLAGGTCVATACERDASIRGLCRRHYKLWWKAQKRGQAASHGPTPAPSPADITGGVLPGAPVHDDARIAWLAGLLEGEGTFTSMTNYPLISVEMADLDVMQRAAQILDAHVRPRTTERGPARGWSPTFCMAVSGARASDWMKALRPWMGERRRGQIDRALAAYRPVRLSTPPPACVVAGCEADHRSRGLCHRHYMQWDRDRRAGREPRVKALR